MFLRWIPRNLEEVALHSFARVWKLSDDSVIPTFVAF
jgi:hypothetical protein